MEARSSPTPNAWDSRATVAVTPMGWVSLRRDAVWLMVATANARRPFDTPAALGPSRASCENVKIPVNCDYATPILVCDRLDTFTRKVNTK